VKWAHDNLFDIANLVDVEQRILAPIRYPDPAAGTVRAHLTGQLDALLRRWASTRSSSIVIDWKDTWGLPGPTAKSVVRRLLPAAVLRVARVQELPERAARDAARVLRALLGAREATVFRSDIADVEADLSALAERFDRAHTERNFPPTPGVHCHFCPSPGACPIFPGVRAEGMITDAATAKRIAREITVAGAALKSRKSALSAYTSAHGPEEVSSHKGRRVWGHKPVERTSRPSKKDMEAALAAQRSGVPIRLEDLFRTSTTTRFELHAPEEHEDIDPASEDAALMAALEASVSAGTVPDDPTEGTT
jgi:hypothetical protein